MGKFTIDGVKYTIEDESNLKETIALIRQSQSHIKAQQELDGAGRILKDTGMNAIGLVNSLGRMIPNAFFGAGTQAGQVASDLYAGEGLNKAGKNIPDQNKIFDMESPQSLPQAGEYDARIEALLHAGKEGLGDVMGYLSHKPEYLRIGEEAALKLKPGEQSKESIIQEAAHRSLAEGAFDVGLTAPMLTPMARLPGRIRAREAAAVEASKKANIEALKQAEFEQTRARNSVEDSIEAELAKQNERYNNQLKEENRLQQELDQILKEGGLTEGDPARFGDMATAAIDSQRRIGDRQPAMRGPQYDASMYAKQGEHYGGRDLEHLSDRMTPEEIRRLNDEFQGDNPVAARLEEMSRGETRNAMREAGQEAREPRLAEDSPNAQNVDPNIVRRRAELYYSAANRLLNEGKSWADVEHLFKKGDELLKQADSIENSRGIDYNTTDVRPNLIESLERASNKSTAIKNTLAEVRRLWNDVEANMQAASDFRMSRTNQGTVKNGPSQATQRNLDVSLKYIQEVSKELQTTYGEYLNKYEQRKLQFYREKADMYRRDVQTSSGVSPNYGEHKVYPDAPVNTSTPHTAPVTGGRLGGKQAGGLLLEKKSKVPTRAEYEKILEREGHKSLPKAVVDRMYEIRFKERTPDTFDAHVNEGANKASTSIVGREADYQIELKPVEQLKADIEGKHSDINTLPEKLSNDITSGAYSTVKQHLQSLQASLSHTARTTNNPIIRVMNSVIEKVKRDIGNKVDLWTRDPEMGITHISGQFMKTNKAEAARMWSEIITPNEGKRWVSSEELRANGFSPEAVKWYEGVQKWSKSILDAFNEVRVGQGRKPIKERPGYWPGMFAHRFQANVFLNTEKGPVVIGRYGAKTKRTLQAALDAAKKRNPNIEFGDIQQRSRGLGKNISQGEAAHIILEDLMSRYEPTDPRVIAARELVQEAIADRVFKHAEGQQHFKAKKGIEGSMGFDPGKSPIDNFKDGVRGATFYAEQMAEWIEINRHDPYVQKLLDPSEIKGQENAQKFTRQHWDVAMKKDLNGHIGKAINAATDSFLSGVYDITGGLISPDASKATAGAIKNLIMINFFGGYNPRYLMTQLAQATQVLPATLMELRSKGIGQGQYMASSILKGFWDTNMYFLGHADPSITSLIKWAEKHDVVKPHFIEEMRAFHNDLLHNRMADLITGAQMIRITEQYARTQYFISTYHYLKDSGWKGNIKEFAANFTNDKMVDYRPESAPLAIQKMGDAGALVSPLMRFKINYASQLVSLISEAAREKSLKGLMPLVSFVGTTFVMSGLVGLPFREDYDRLLDILEKAGYIDPFHKWKIEDQIYNANNNKDFWSQMVNFGGLSAATGMDLSLSFASPSVTNTENLTVIPGKVIDTFKGAMQSKKEGNLGPILSQVLPSGGPLRGAFEDYYTDRRGDVTDVKDPKKGIKVQRSDEERFMRYVGSRSIRESIETHRKFLKDKHENARKEQYKSAREELIREIRGGNKYPEKPLGKMLDLGADREAIRGAYREAGRLDWTPTDRDLNRRSRSRRMIEQQNFLRGNESNR